MDLIFFRIVIVFNLYCKFMYSSAFLCIFYCFLDFKFRVSEKLVVVCYERVFYLLGLD